MKAVIQRVRYCKLSINGRLHASIGQGLLVLLGIGTEDNIDDITKLSHKLVRLRIFSDENGKMNFSVKDINGAILLVSQFTLLANTQKGNRPSFVDAARPEQAIPLYETMINTLSETLGKPVTTGVFGADMQIELLNDGPVTISIDSKEKS